MAVAWLLAGLPALADTGESPDYWFAPHGRMWLEATIERAEPTDE